MILADGTTRYELDGRLALDPLNQHGLAECAVVTFAPSRTALGLEALITTQG